MSNIVWVIEVRRGRNKRWEPYHTTQDRHHAVSLMERVSREAAKDRFPHRKSESFRLSVAALIPVADVL
jgi:hypothetical protein